MHYKKQNENIWLRFLFQVVLGLTCFRSMKKGRLNNNYYYYYYNNKKKKYSNNNNNNNNTYYYYQF